MKRAGALVLALALALAGISLHGCADLSAWPVVAIPVAAGVLLQQHDGKGRGAPASSTPPTPTSLPGRPTFTLSDGRQVPAACPDEGLVLNCSDFRCVAEAEAFLQATIALGRGDCQGLDGNDADALACNASGLPTSCP